MKTKIDIEKELARLKSDERLSYPPANVFVNAPLALVQQDLESRVAMLQWVLEVGGAVEHRVHPTSEILLRLREVSTTKPDTDLKPGSSPLTCG